MATAQDLISLALFDAGVFGLGQTPTAMDMNNGLTRLNDMIAQWQKNRWLVYHLLDLSAPCTGALNYTIGPGQTFDTPLPDRLEYAYIRQTTPAAPNQPDWPLELIQSREQYSAIQLKQLGSFPSSIFYDSGWPTGLLYPWPLPSSLYELHILVKAALQTFPTLTTAFNMPDEYRRAIRFNLQQEFLSAYKLPPDDGLARRAAAALNVIRNANAQIPMLRMPRELYRPGFYNVYSDGYN